MRVLIDTTYRLRAPFSGTAIYTERVCEALRREGTVDLIKTANRRRRPPAGGGVGSVQNLLRDWWWTERELPMQADRAGAELVHHVLPAYGRLTRVPQVITVHDLAFERRPQDFAGGFRRYAHQAHRAAARAAAAVICVSEATASDVRELWGVSKQRIVVAHHGPGQELQALSRERGWDQHFLYVGDDEPRKNLDALLAAHRIYRQAESHPVPLVLAGTMDRPQAECLVERSPSRERLAELYAAAVALVHPSRYEGFGLTALEAMSVGTPVLAARDRAVCEVCGDAVEYFDHGDSRELAAAMARVAADPQLRQSMSERGRRRAARFSWERSAKAHLTAYAMALEGLPSSGT